MQRTRERADYTEEQFKAFRESVRRLRKENKLTVKALSELVDCSVNHAYAIESGNKYPSEPLMKDFADVFDTTVAEMCGIKQAHEETPTSNEIAPQIGVKYLEKRIERGYTINEVAGFLGINRTMYMGFESGKCVIGSSVLDALNKLYKHEVETVEVVKTVTVEADSPITLDTIDKVLGHITDLNIGSDEQRALFRELSDARTQMLERKLFG